MHKVLIIGVGSIGERHTRCFQATGRADLAICEINDTLRADVAERYNIARAYADLDAALADKHDLAVICAPAHCHVPMARQLAEAGVHLLIEKPLSVNLDGVEELRDLVASRGLFAAVAYTYRAHRLLAAVRDAVESAEYGCPLSIQFIVGQHFPTFRPAYRDIYYTRHETGGGCIQDGMTHLLNAGEWLCGPVERLVCDARHAALPGVEVEDMAHVLARHRYDGAAGRGEVAGMYGMIQYQAKRELVLTVACEAGCLRTDLEAGTWMSCEDTRGPWIERGRFEAERDVTYIDQAIKTLDAMENGSPPLCSLDEGIQTLRGNLAALASVRDGAWKTVA